MLYRAQAYEPQVDLRDHPIFFELFKKQRSIDTGIMIRHSDSYQCILHGIIFFLIKYHNILKCKWITLQILILLFDSSFFNILKILNTSFIYINMLIKLYCFFFNLFAKKSLIVFWINQEFTDSILVLQSFILCRLFKQMLRLNTMTLMLYQSLPNNSYLLQIESNISSFSIINK